LFTDPLFLLALPAYLICIAALTALSGRLAFSTIAPAAIVDASDQAVANPLGQRLAALPALAAFLFLPLGSLPPFLPLSTGMFAFFALFCLSLLLLGLLPGAASPAARAKVAVAAGYGLLPLAGASAAAAFFAYAHGAPGAPFNMGTFSIMPLWLMADIPARAGLAVMAVGLLLCIGKGFPLAPHAAFAWNSLRLAVAHTFLTLLLPPLFIRLTPDLSLPLLCLLEAGLRWLLAFLLAHRIMPLADRVQSAAAGPLLFGLGLGLMYIFSSGMNLAKYGL